MIIIKSYTDLEQSEKLAKILPLESADMYWRSLKLNGHISWTSHIKRLEPPIYDLEHYIPCWSLAALLGVLPKIHKLKPILDLEECSIQYSGIDLYIVADNPVDACYEMIIKLKEINLI